MALTGVLLADFSAFTKEAGTATSSLKTLQTTGDEAGKKLSGLGSGFDIKKAISDPIGTATTGMTEFAGALGPVGLMAVGVTTSLVAVGAAMFKLASDAASVGSALGDLHDKTGMSVPVLSQLSNAAQVIGADMGQLTDVVFKLEKGIGENSAEFQKGLKAMGTSTAELKAAGPDQYLQIIAAGLQNIPDATARAAAGTAILGKSFSSVAATLMDLDAGMKLTADLSPWTEQQAADAEAFEMQVASLKLHLADVATTIGRALIPAMSLAVEGLSGLGKAMVTIVDLGGLVSGSYNKLKDVLGEGALKQQEFGAVMDTATRLFNEQGATAESVAQKMLGLGYSADTVAKATGMTTEAVNALNIALKITKQEADDTNAAWGRVNAALALGPPSLDGVSKSTQDLALSMKNAGAEMKDITTTTGVTVQQMALIQKQVADAVTAAAAQFAAAFKNAQDAAKEWAGIDELLAKQAIKNRKELSDAFSASAKPINDVVAQNTEAQIRLNKAVGLDAFGSVTVAATAYDTLSATLTKLHAQERAGLDVKALIAEAEKRYTDETLANARAQDEATQAQIRSNEETRKAAEVTRQAADAKFTMNSAFSLDPRGDMAKQAAAMGGEVARDSYGNPYVHIPGVNAPGRASGGPVSAGQPYVVGEQGPELFVPRTSGLIAPNGGGGGVVQNIYISHPLGTPDAIARAVGEAQVALMKGQGMRMPYGT